MPLLGKSSKSLTKGNDIHLLIYHCLDVAAVADCWWDQISRYCKYFFPK
ncbi:HD domain-containing protein [Escherichia coli]